MKTNPLTKDQKVISIRNDELREIIIKLAKKNHRSINQQVIVIITEWLKANNPRQ